MVSDILQAIPALSSLAFSLNWGLNFLVAALFLPLRNLLSSPAIPGDPMSARNNEGRVFYVFMVMCWTLAVVVWRGLPKTSGAGVAAAAVGSAGGGGASGQGVSTAGLGLGRV